MIFLIVKATVSCLFDQDTHALDQTPPHYILPKKYFHPPICNSFYKINEC